MPLVTTVRAARALLGIDHADAQEAPAGFLGVLAVDEDQLAAGAHARDPRRQLLFGRQRRDAGGEAGRRERQRLPGGAEGRPVEPTTRLRGDQEHPPHRLAEQLRERRRVEDRDRAGHASGQRLRHQARARSPHQLGKHQGI